MGNALNDQPIKVLIAEDDFLVSQMTTNILENLGYEVVGRAINGRQAIDLVQSLRPDVLVTDIKMPDMDGLEAAQRLSEIYPIPVVVLTAYDMPELVKQASQVGIGAYLVKPPNVRELERAISVARARFDDLMALKQVNEKLTVRNEELDAFAYTVAHDLQSGLGLMIAVADTLNLHYDTMKKEEMKEYLQDLVQGGHRLSNVIRELLLLASIRKEEVVHTPLSMARIASEAQNRLIAMIREYQAEIAMPTEWPEAVGHGPWIEEVWVNYLSNAIKYGGTPPLIEVGAEAHPEGTVTFWVRDNGDGIALEQQADLFRPFTRLDEVRATGQGLGLSIVRRIVEKLGGQVGIESDGIAGQGCVFSFTLAAKL